MKKQFHLEGERITQKKAKEIFGEERFRRVLRESKGTFLTDPLIEIAYLTRLGIITITFQLD